MWTFETPEYLFLLLLVPPGIYFRHFWRNRGGRISFPFRIWGSPGFAAPAGTHTTFLALSAVLFWAGIVLLVVALAGPIFTIRERVFLNRGIDIMVVLDESPSMSSLDYPPVNRFVTAKSVIKDFVAGRENDPIGIVTFGTEAALRVPPTLDYASIAGRLDGLQLMDLGEGTSIGMGLAVASLHLKMSTAKEKVIILITDGENNAGEILPETASEIAAQMGIKIYTIGIGTGEEVPFEYRDPHTGKTYRGTNRSSLNDTLLKKISAMTGGAYFYAGSPGTLKAVFNTIDSLETVEKRVRIRVESIPENRPFIFAGLLLILLKFFIRKLLLKEVM